MLALPPIEGKGMASSAAPHVLVVACKTATDPALLAAVTERADRGPCAFTLLVPAPTSTLERLTDPDDADRGAAQEILDAALPRIREAAGGAPVDGIVGDPTPLNAIADAVNVVGFDEIIISTLPHAVSRWLHLDLPHKAAGLGLPVTTVSAAA